MPTWYRNSTAERSSLKNPVSRKNCATRARWPAPLVSIIIIDALLGIAVIGVARLLAPNANRQQDDFDRFSEMPDQPLKPDFLLTPTPEPEPQTLSAGRSVANAILTAVNRLLQQEGLAPLVLDNQPADTAYSASLSDCLARQRDR